eukprot:750465-Hanusia_phi.AAC.2
MAKPPVLPTPRSPRPLSPSAAAQEPTTRSESLGIAGAAPDLLVGDGGDRGRTRPRHFHGSAGKIIGRRRRRLEEAVAEEEDEEEKVKPVSRVIVVPAGGTSRCVASRLLAAS